MVIGLVVMAFYSTMMGKPIRQKIREFYSLGLQDYKIHVSFDEERGCWHLAINYKYSEILGNVFDNPELLGGVAQHSI